MEINRRWILERADTFLPIPRAIWQKWIFGRGQTLIFTALCVSRLSTGGLLTPGLGGSEKSAASALSSENWTAEAIFWHFFTQWVCWWWCASGPGKLSDDKILPFSTSIKLGRKGLNLESFMLSIPANMFVVVAKYAKRHSHCFLTKTFFEDRPAFS